MRSVLIKRVGVGKIVRSIVASLFRVLTFFIPTRSAARFLRISPSTLVWQILYDREKSRFFTVKVRDQIDYSTLLQIYDSQDYDITRFERGRQVEELYREIVAGGKKPLILDCGANIGLAARYFSDAYPASKIVGIEPVSENIKQAQANNAHLQHVEFIHAAVGGESGRGILVDPALGNNAFRIAINPEGSIPIISIGDLLAKYTDQHYVPFIIKIDIEGFEKEVFLGNTDWVESFPLLIIELHDWLLPRRRTSSNFLKVIAQLDRDFLSNEVNVFSFSNSLT